MYIASQQNIDEVNTYTMEQLYIPEAVLMENAGAAVAQVIATTFPQKDIAINVIAGTGKNGGVGFVIARRLHDLGYINTTLYVVGDVHHVADEALLYYRAYRARALPFELSIPPELTASVIIDCLVSTTAAKGLEPAVRSAIRAINRSDSYVFAVDIPSGLEVNTGAVPHQAVFADETITFTMPKRGFFLQQGPLHIGAWRVANISVPNELIKQFNWQLPRVITEADIAAFLPQRPQFGHKGTFGHGVVIGGARAYVGAPIYTIKAAFQSGIGLITAAMPQQLYSIIAANCPEALQLPLASIDGHLQPFALQNLDFTAYTAIAIGPGVSRFAGGEHLLQQCLQRTNVPLVIDADGLYYAKQLLETIKRHHAPVIMTPHPGEMAALLGETVTFVEENRFEVAQKFAVDYSVYVLLKGHRSIIATPQGQLWINPYGNDALGKGGSGDVLTGLILSLLCQGAEPAHALVVASSIHAKAGEQLGKQKSTYAVTPLQVIDAIAEQLKSYTEA